MNELTGVPTGLKWRKLFASLFRWAFILAWVIGSIWFLAAFVIAIFVIVDLFSYLQSPLHWPAVQGTITLSNVYETEDQGPYRYVWFAYLVDDELYTGVQKFKPGPDEGLKYSQGNMVQVYYNRIDPETAVVQPDCSVWSVAADEIGADLIFISLVIPTVIGTFRILEWLYRKNIDIENKLKTTC